METVCYRCGSPVEGQSSFCPSCGAPQIRVSPRESQGPESPEPSPPPPPPADSLSAPVDLLRVGQPGLIEWKRFLRIAAPLALAVAFFTPYSPLVAWLVLLPGSVFLAILFYRRRQPGPLSAGQGAKLGVVIGLLTFAVLAVFFAILVAHDPAAYRQDAENAVREALARNPSPQAETVRAMFSGTRGIAFLTAIGMAILLVFLLVISAVSGALAASLGRNRSGS